jgi:hypothetical protein
VADSRSYLWALSGHLGDWQNLTGIYRYDGTKWKNYLEQNYPVMGTGCCGWWFIYPSRYSADVWVSGWGNGLLRIIGGGDSLFRYTDANSILAYNGSPGFDLCAGMDEDQNGKLWVLNSFVEKPIIDWSDSIAYPLPGGSSTSAFFDNMIIDNYNTKWMVLDPTYSGIHGVVYFNETANTGLLMGYTDFSSDVVAVNDICKDKDGQIWVATNNGIFIITDPYQVIQNPNSIPYMQKMRIIENGISTPLTENVYSVKTDGVNNKWIGTYSNGLLYVSSDGSTLINRIVKGTTALIDNRINYLAPDKGTGKIYIATQSGLCSFQTVAVQPLTDCDKIKAGPNPFLIPNDNLLRISGLVENSSVKILSISGKLVIDFPSPGGKIANWDGRDKNGNYVASGIYIIVGYNPDGSKVCTGKVAVIRK